MAKLSNLYLKLILLEQQCRTSNIQHTKENSEGNNNIYFNSNNLSSSGYTHSSGSPLYNIGSTVSDGVREFAETGATDTLDKEAADNIFLDTIIAPPVEQGVGETSTNVFVDSNNTKVSHAIL